MKKNLLWVMGSLVGVAAIVLIVAWYTGDFSLSSEVLNAKTIRAAYHEDTKGFALSGVAIEKLPDLCKILPRATQRKVEYVVINNTPIEHVDRDISCLPNLKTLDLSNNHITSIAHLVTSTNLRELNLSHNYLISLDWLGNYPKLTSLKVYNNNLTDVSEASNYKLLEKFLLQNNKLKDLSGLKLRNIKEINVEGNPLDPKVISSFNTFSAKHKEEIQ